MLSPGYFFSKGVFFVKLDKKDSGKTKAALPTRTNPSKIELMQMDFPGLQIRNNKSEYS